MVASAQLAAYVTGGLATATPATGWCVFLGKPAGSPLTNEDAGRIAMRAIKAIDDGAGVQALNPLWVALADGAKKAIVARLAEWRDAGTPCDQIPANLATDPKISSAIPDQPGEVIGPTLSAVLDFTGFGTVLADLLPRLAFLAGIVVLLVLAIRRVLD